MPAKKIKLAPKLNRDWTLPPAATLGSAVRARGILLEIRARLSSSLKKSIDISGIVLTLGMDDDSDFQAVSKIVSSTLESIESLPVIPREIEDILTISTTERHRWLKDGRLQSAGTRTVKLRGRAKKITFHVFDPRQVEDLLNRDVVETWREQDAITASENRRRAVWKAKLKRAEKAGGTATPATEEGAGPQLIGWEEFARDGLLR